MSDTEHLRIARGTPAFRKTIVALFIGGFSIFAQLYCVQPMIPMFAREFSISAAAASLSVSATTAGLAIGMLFTGALSEAIGRKPMMVASVFGSAALLLLSTLVTTWHELVVIRTLTGFALSGLPSIAMAYVSEEIETKSVGFAMGLFIGGSAIGGMMSRFVAGSVSDATSWRTALIMVGTMGIINSALFYKALAPSRNFVPKPQSLRSLLNGYRLHLSDPGLRVLFAMGFLVMGSFVTMYNYLGFRLLAPPFNLNQTQVSSIFLVYVAGIGSSTIVGALGDLLGRRRVLWVTLVIMLVGLSLSLINSVAMTVVAMAIYTFGFFGAHSVASTWVGRRASVARAQASSLYLLCYYMGSSVVGTVGGVALALAGWAGVVGMVAVLLSLALAGALWLTQLPPVASAEQNDEIIPPAIEG